MATPAEIDQQVKLERRQIRQGLEELRNNTCKLEQKDYASATVYGVSSIDKLLPIVAEHLISTRERVRKGKNGASFKHIHNYLNDIEPEIAAAITCKVAFDKIFSVKPKNALVQHVTIAIGSAIEDECMMRYYEKTVPGLLKYIKDKYWHASSGTHQKVKNVITLMNRHDVKHWQRWSTDVRTKLGTWLLGSLCDSSGWFMRDTRREGKKTYNYIVPTPEFMEIKDQVMATAELFSPLTWPMLIEPNDWENDRPGGYLLNEVMRGNQMVRRGDNTLIQGETPIDFLNKIQKVAYTLNPFIVEVAEHFERKGIKVGKFIPIVEIPLPPKPADIADNETSRKAYCRAAAEVCNLNAQAFQKSCRTRMTLNAVKIFKEHSKFYIPWSFDYRGRAYPIPAFLTPQDTDFGKSLLKFYEGSFMTPEAEAWLAFQVATTYGLDKATMQERQQWVQENQSLITRVAEDPIRNLSDWDEVDEPWQFLAACEEYYATCIACTRHETSLPVATDATCSGLQILAGLARDASTAKLVNVLPSSKPQDAYKVVAEAAAPHVPETVKPHMDRKTVKRVVMTVPYNAKPFSNRGYIREALKEKGVEVEKEDLTATVKAVRDAMNQVVPGPMRVMKWIETEVGNAIDRGHVKLTWTTPSGFIVNQKLMKPEVQDLNLQLLGRCKIKIRTGDSDKVDKSHHKNATAPNLIHSLDASLLHLSALRFDAPLALIHDSVLCRATDMDVLSSIVREVYMHLFAEHDYLTSFAQQIGAETDPPIIDTLEPRFVIDSTYFFC